MKSRTLFTTTALAVAALTHVAVAQPAGFAPGTQVKDPAGGDVGTVVTATADTITIRTDKHEVRLPPASFRPQDGKLVMGVTRAQLNAQVEQALAAADARLVPGIQVHGGGGVTVGTLQAIDASFATIKLTSGTVVRLPRAGITAGPSGAVLGLTAAELEALARPATPQT